MEYNFKIKESGYNLRVAHAENYFVEVFKYECIWLWNFM